MPTWSPREIELPDFKLQNVDVGMPVLSVKHLAKRGSRVTFWDEGGVIVLPDGNTIPFYETHGIYYVKFKVKPPADSEMPTFGGQGS